MSQIPRSQFVLKKRQNSAPMVVIPPPGMEEQNVAKAKKSHANGSSNGNGHKNGNFDDDVMIIEEEMFAVVRNEEVIASSPTVVIEQLPSFEQVSPSKKKRSRKSKDSTESKDSDFAKKVEEVVRSAEKAVKASQKLSTEEIVAPIFDEEVEIAATPAETKELKIVKLTCEGLSSLKRRSDRLQNASTIVNLSSFSTSDQSTKIMESDDTLEASVTERRVSGRRSTRPIDDIKFTYRNQNPDESNANATLGSEINDSLLATPGNDRQRHPLNESMENIGSPKRSRLDLSGLFSSFSSPVAMLRNRFKRTNIASTPIIGEVLLNESVESLDGSFGDELEEVELNGNEEVAPAPIETEEELKVITTPIKKSHCVVM